MKRIRGILVDTRKGISTISFEYVDYKSITELLGCQWITCVSRLIGGTLVDVYCDEEALLKEAREPAIITRDKSSRKIVEVLYGDCFICTHSKKGGTKSLKASEIENILLAQANVSDSSRTYQVLQAEI